MLSSRARSLQVDQVGLTFLLRERYRAQLVSRHSFRVAVDTGSGPLEGAFDWQPPKVFGAQFTCVISAQQPSSGPLLIYWLVVLVGSILHLVLWYWVPKRIWRDENDAQTLRDRALSAIKPADSG